MNVLKRKLDIGKEGIKQRDYEELILTMVLLNIR